MRKPEADVKAIAWMNMPEKYRLRHRLEYTTYMASRKYAIGRLLNLQTTLAGAYKAVATLGHSCFTEANINHSLKKAALQMLDAAHGESVGAHFRTQRIDVRAVAAKEACFGVP